MSAVAVAIIGSAAIGAAVAGAGAEAQTEAITDAATITANATAETNAMLQAQYEQTRADQEPWRLAGERALKQIEATPDFQFEAKEFDFFADPSYQFRMEEGVKALDRSAASRGRVQSGGQQRAVTRYASDLASQEYGNAFNRFRTQEADRYNREIGTYTTNLNRQRGLAGQGLQSVNAISAAGQNLVGQQSQNVMSGAGALSSLALQQGQVESDLYGQYGNIANQAIGNYLLMS